MQESMSTLTMTNCSYFVKSIKISILKSSQILQGFILTDFFLNFFRVSRMNFFRYYFRMPIRPSITLKMRTEISRWKSIEIFLRVPACNNHRIFMGIPSKNFSENCSKCMSRNYWKRCFSFFFHVFDIFVLRNTPVTSSWIISQTFLGFLWRFWRYSFDIFYSFSDIFYFWWNF